MFFINEVFASEAVNTVATTPSFQNFTATLVPLLIFVGVFYILLIRPQQKKQKQHEAEISSLKQNDKVITAGGIFATIQKVKEKTLILEIADNVEIEVLSETVSLSKDLDKKVEIKEKKIKEKEENVAKTTKKIKNKK